MLTELENVHGNKYKYINILFNKPYYYIEAECNTHGEFTQRLSTHMTGAGCRQCGLQNRWNTRRNICGDESFNTFVEKANKVHNGEYTYSKESFLNRDKNHKIKIHCKLHGNFDQVPGMHVAGNGCPECARLKNPGKYNDSYFEKNPEKKNIPAVLYFVKFKEFYKIGISTQTAKARFKGAGPYEILNEFETTLLNAFAVEQRTLQEFEDWHYTGNTRLKARGNTERFSIEAPYEKIIKYIKENL